MINDLRNLDRKCIYCNAAIDVECEEGCYLYVFTKSVLSSPAFVPSSNISKKVGQLFADEILTYMQLVTRALEEVGFMGRMQALAQDYEELHTFATSLYECGKLQDGNEVLEFYKNPKEYENMSRMWIELGKPINEKSESWLTYRTFVESNYGK